MHPEESRNFIVNEMDLGMLSKIQLDMVRSLLGRLQKELRDQFYTCALAKPVGVNHR